MILAYFHRSLRFLEVRFRDTRFKPGFPFDFEVLVPEFVRPPL